MDSKSINWGKPIESTQGLPARLLHRTQQEIVNGCHCIVLITNSHGKEVIFAIDDLGRNASGNPCICNKEGG